MRLSQAKVHFVGVGGIGMSGIAELLHNMGASVSGSDLSDNQQVQHLRAMGVPVSLGHSADNLGECDVVVYSSAIRPDNIEYVTALKRRIPLIPRAEALAEIMRLKRGISVAGTHGKTTTTSLLASIFLAVGLDPTIVVGVRLEVIQSTALLGRGEWLIAESDESDGSFHRLSPEIVIITNIDNDHLDHYGSFENLQKAYHEFASRIPFYGCLIVCGDDIKSRKLFQNFGKRVIFYGTDRSNHFVLKGSRSQYEVFKEDQLLGEFTLPLPGLHNALNATAAAIAALEAGVSFEVTAAALKTFRGVGRRFQKRGEVAGIDFYDDYGHHPTEIEAVLSGFREMFPDRQIKVIFQPHRYTRTRICWPQFLDCFDDCDELHLLDIYPAGEAPIEGVHSEKLAQSIHHRNVHYMSQRSEAALMEIAQKLKNQDIVLTLGAGDVWKLGDQIMAFRARHA
jgi:UDP-N-acetylmuramate--alanine ligase